MNQKQQFAYSLPLQTSHHRHAQTMRKRLFLIESIVLIFLFLALLSLNESVAYDIPWMGFVFQKSYQTKDLEEPVKPKPALNISTVVQSTAKVLNLLSETGNSTEPIAIVPNETSTLTPGATLLEKTFKKRSGAGNETFMIEFGLNNLITRFPFGEKNVSFTNLQNFSTSSFFPATIVQSSVFQGSVKDLQGVTISIHHLITSSLYPIFLSLLILLIHLARLFIKLSSAEDSPLTSSLLRPSRKHHPSKVPLALVGVFSMISLILVSISLVFWYYRYVPDAFSIFTELVKPFVPSKAIAMHSKLQLLKGYFYALGGAVICLITSVFSITFLTVCSSREVEPKSSMSYCSHPGQT